MEALKLLYLPHRLGLLKSMYEAIITRVDKETLSEEKSALRSMVEECRVCNTKGVGDVGNLVACVRRQLCR